MLSTLAVLIACVSILLIAAILIQNPKGGGVASGIIGANQLMGVKKTTDFIEKLTWGLVIGLVSLCLLAGFALPKKGDREIGTKMQEQIDAGAAPTTTPAAPQQPAQQPAQQQPAQGEPAQQQPAQ